jgi:hypothetical protein
MEFSRKMAVALCDGRGLHAVEDNSPGTALSTFLVLSQVTLTLATTVESIVITILQMRKLRHRKV